MQVRFPGGRGESRWTELPYTSSTPPPTNENDIEKKRGVIPLTHELTLTLTYSLTDLLTNSRTHLHLATSCELRRELALRPAATRRCALPYMGAERTQHHAWHGGPPLLFSSCAVRPGPAAAALSVPDLPHTMLGGDSERTGWHWAVLLRATPLPGCHLFQ